MATAEFKEVCNKFSASTGGKPNEINNKCMKKICVDCDLAKCGISSTDADIEFSGALAKAGGKGKKTLTPDQLYELWICSNGMKKKCAGKLKCDAEEVGAKVAEKIAGGAPKGHGTTGTSKTGGVAKMTDASQYTGAHKERFDADGKGKGAAGREDKADNSGYVGNYKGDGTYDKK